MRLFIAGIVAAPDIDTNHLFTIDYKIIDSDSDLLLRFEWIPPFDSINLTITVSIHTGRIGLLVRVSDCGKGFNVQKVFKHYVKKKRYFSLVGSGIRLMALSPHFSVFYNQKGTTVNLLYLFDNGLTMLPADLIVASPESQDGSKEFVKHPDIY